MDRPLVSAVVITYKAEKYIKETLDSVFSQNYENLEIVITDDNSPDNTFEIIKEYVSSYKGNSKVILNQNNPNLGIAGNVNKGINLSHGDYICIFDGDDVAYPNRISQSLDIILKHQVKGMTSNMDIINGAGTRIGLFDTDTYSDSVVFGIDEYLSGKAKNGGASRMFSRELVNLYGDLNEDCNTEDTTYFFRNLLSGGIAYCHHPLVKYRIHGNNISKGANLYERFNPVLIYNQYNKDFETAQHFKIISQQQIDKVSKFLEDYKKRECCMYSLYHKKTFWKRLCYIFSLINDKQLKAAHKKMFIWRFLAWTKNGI